MAKYSYWESFLERQIYIDLVFTVQKLYREFPLFDLETIEKIESFLVEFYEKNSNTRIKPRTLCAVLVYHFSQRLAVTMSHICCVFDINITWFRKKRKEYLNKVGLENHVFSLNEQQSEWRLFDYRLGKNSDLNESDGSFDI